MLAGNKMNHSPRCPTFLIVDGGKGQLSRAVQVLDNLGLTGMFGLAGLAKQEEELFFPENPTRLFCRGIPRVCIWCSVCAMKPTGLPSPRIAPPHQGRPGFPVGQG
jgi:hypothetical protein